MPLSDEDKRRIQEEEQFRARARIRAEAEERDRLEQEHLQVIEDERLRQLDLQQRQERVERERQIRRKTWTWGLILGAIILLYGIGALRNQSKRADTTTPTIGQAQATTAPKTTTPVETVKVSFTSDPSGANVTVNGTLKGATPLR